MKEMTRAHYMNLCMKYFTLGSNHIVNLNQNAKSEAAFRLDFI
jgi:hypothetical protein